MDQNCGWCGDGLIYYKSTSGYVGRVSCVPVKSSIEL